MLGPPQDLKRGDIYMGNLAPQKGSEQAGVRPVLIIQVNVVNRVGNTVVIIPFTTSLKAARLKTAVLVKKGEGGLREDSIALCHQIRVLDKTGLTTRLGTLSSETLRQIEEILRFTLGM